MSPERARPINPEEVVEEKLKTMPDGVIESFNELIARNNRGGYSVVGQNEVLSLIVSKGFNRSEVFANGWLDVEDLYRKAGWIVEYDKPGYNEDYEATFTFRTSKRKSPRS